jgi:hypothetical protein
MNTTAERETIAAQSRYLLAQSARILAGLDNDQLALEPSPGMKTAGWLIGHLAVTGDFARRLCGREPLCPKEWRATFNPGTHPSADPSVYPPLPSLRERLVAVYSDLAASFPSADESALGTPNPYAPARDGFPTAGDFVAYLMTGHFAYHLGQLFAWRAAAGMRASGN